MKPCGRDEDTTTSCSGLRTHVPASHMSKNCVCTLLVWLAALSTLCSGAFASSRWGCDGLCSGHGYCLEGDTVCRCIEGFVGPDCSQRKLHVLLVTGPLPTFAPLGGSRDDHSWTRRRVSRRNCVGGLPRRRRTRTCGICRVLKHGERGEKLAYG